MVHHASMPRDNPVNDAEMQTRTPEARRGARLRVLRAGSAPFDSPMIGALEGHGALIQAIVALPDRASVVSSSEDGTIRVWDLTTGDALELRAHRSPVNDIALSDDGERLCSASDDGTIIVWDTADWSCVHTLTGHTDYVSTVVFVGDLLVSGSKDTTCRVWDTRSGTCLRRFYGHDAWVTTAAALPDEARVVTASVDGAVLVWSVARRGKVVRAASGQTQAKLLGFEIEKEVEIRGEEVEIKKVEARAIDTGPRQSVEVSYDDTSAPKLGTLIERQYLILGADDAPRVVQTTPDGRALVLANRSLKIRDRQSDEERTFGQGPWWIRDVVLTRDGTRAFVASDRVRLFRLDDGEELAAFGGGQELTALALSPDERLLYVGTKAGTVEMWNISAVLDRPEPARHFEAIHAIACSPDSQLFATGAYDGSAAIWDLATCERKHVLTHQNAFVDVLAFVGSNRLLTATHDGEVALWDVASGKAHIKHHEALHWVQAASPLPDGRRAVTISVSNGLSLWDLEREARSIRLQGTEEHHHSLSIVCRGTRIVALSAASKRAPAQIWDAETGALLHAIPHKRCYTRVAALPDDERVVLGDAEGTLTVLDARSGRVERSFQAHPRSWVTEIAVLPDGRVASMVEDKPILSIWDPISGEAVVKLTLPRSKRFRHLRALGDATRVLVVADGRLLLVHLDEGSIDGEFSAKAELTALAVDPSGYTIIAGDRSGLVHMLALEQR